MPKINVYLPDDLAAAVRQARVPVSTICQQALAEAVRVADEAREAVQAMRDPGFDPRQQPRIGARVTDRMTDHLRQVIHRAGELAGADRLMGTADLLVGVIDEPDNLGGQVLRSLGVDVAGLRDAAARAGVARDRESTTASRTDDRQRDEELLDGLSTSARLAVAAALEAATDLGHGFLGCEHLVLALAEQADGGAGELMREAGIRPESIRRAIPPALAAAALGYRNARQLLAPPVASRLDDIDRRLDELDKRLQTGGL